MEASKNEHGKTIKPTTIESYKTRMGCMSKGNCMSGSSTMNQHTFRWTKNLFCPLLDVSMLSNWLLFSCYGYKICQ